MPADPTYVAQLEQALENEEPTHAIALAILVAGGAITDVLRQQPTVQVTRGEFRESLKAQGVDPDELPDGILGAVEEGLADVQRRFRGLVPASEELGEAHELLDERGVDREANDGDPFPGALMSLYGRVLEYERVMRRRVAAELREGHERERNELTARLRKAEEQISYLGGVLESAEKVLRTIAGARTAEHRLTNLAQSYLDRVGTIGGTPSDDEVKREERPAGSMRRLARLIGPR